MTKTEKQLAKTKIPQEANTDFIENALIVIFF